MKTLSTFIGIMLFAFAFQARSQTARTVITLDGTSPDRYSQDLTDSTYSSLGKLLSGLEAEFGSLEEPGTISEVEKKLNNLEQSDILSKIARINRKYYASLIEMGFTTDEAMKIIIANPILELIKKEEGDMPKKSRTLSLEMQ